MTQEHHDKGNHNTVPEKPVHEPEKQLATGATITNTDEADLPRGNSRTWITVIAVIIVVLIVLGLIWMAVILPNITAASADAKKLQDQNNLKRLVEAYIAGQSSANRPPQPKSTGFRFWVALFTGDGPDGSTPEGDSPRTYLAPDRAALLVCPVDSVPDLTVLPNKLSEALKSGKGAHAADSSWCSYAGPKDPATLMKRGGSIIGATGSRDGRGFFADGFSAVDASGNARFYEYSQMAAEYGWPTGAKAPLWDSDLLAHVTNIE